MLVGLIEQSNEFRVKCPRTGSLKPLTLRGTDYLAQGPLRVVRFESRRATVARTKVNAQLKESSYRSRYQTARVPTATPSCLNFRRSPPSQSLPPMFPDVALLR